jgi:hypothetical protein
MGNLTNNCALLALRD